MQKIHLRLIVLTLTVISNTVMADLDHCFLEQLKSASNDQSVADIKAYCSANQTTAINNQKKPDHIAISNTESKNANYFSNRNNAFISAYKPNYFLFATYNDSINNNDFNTAFPGEDLDKVEAKFQISFKAAIAKGVLGGDLWGAYTQQSWWQLYNKKISSPFRETNYEPEIFLLWNTNNNLWGFDNDLIAFGFNHESNGREELLSRSWNRLIASTTFEKDQLAIITRAWYRIPESAEDDDNPDITRYMGYGDIKLIYHTDVHLFTATMTNNLRKHNRGGIQLDWTFPMTDHFKAYIQYYNGYGESLIDYNKSINRIGFGVLLNDWL